MTSQWGRALSTRRGDKAGISSYDRSSDVRILRWRRKLEPDPGARRIIQPERGIGSLFALRVKKL
jgi:DNA-binding response OmpR family regulator